MPDALNVDLILASTSPYRRALLERLGVPFRCEAPGIDEEGVKLEGGRPLVLASRLARSKAEAVFSRYPGTTVIGGDQLAVLEGVVLGKPGSTDAARAQLGRLQGRTHELITATTVISPDRVLDHLDAARLTMRTLGPEEIARYVAADHPTDCAGSYKFECRGICLFEKIETADPTAITGLPLMALTSMLRELGFAIP